MQLQREHLSEIENIASDPAQARNRELLQHVTDLYLRTVDRQSAHDTNAFGDVLDKLAYQLDDGPRANLSERLSILERAPVKLIQKLATDKIDVAKHVLELSPCLDDAFLVDIIRSKSQDHMFAVAGRALLAPLVTDEIVIHGEPYVLYRVTSNPEASFSVQGLEALTANATNNPELGHALGTRPDVSEELRDRIDGHRNEIRPAEFFALDFEGLDELHDANGSSSQTAESEQAPITVAEDDVDEAILLHSAGVNDLEETIVNFAKIASIPPATARYLLLRSEIPALAIICKASRVLPETFAALLKLRMEAQGLNPAIAAPNIERYSNLGIRTAQRLSTMLKMKFAESLSA